ncbi:retrovirus-related pol polyprotein from transposon TNT 1-94 [Tanacetum coccineum]
MNVSNSTGVESPNSIRRLRSKDPKSKDRVLKNNNDKRPSAHVQKMSSSVSIDSNKHEIMHSNVCQSNASVLSTKTVNAVNDGLNIVCVSCGKDVFLLSHEKCVAFFALSRNSSVKRSLFTTPIPAKSKKLGATSVVAKSRLSVAKTPTTTNKVSSVLPLSPNSSQSRTLTCEQGKSKKAPLPSKLVPSTESKLELLHMDLCGPMRVASMNGKKYILVIVDAYSRYTWVYFLCTKDEAPNMIIDFINQVQRNLKAQNLTTRTDNGTEFKNEKLQAFYAKLVEAAQTMLIFSKTPEFLWAEVIATACFTQNCYIVHVRYNKTHYELIRGRKPNIQYFYVFGSLCYLTNDRDDLGKMKPKADIGIFIGYSESSRGFLQFEPHVLASKAKKAAKNLDLLAPLAHLNASSSQSHANSSYSPQPYYVTHPSSVVDDKDEYQGELQGDSQEDKLTTAMILLARAITHNFSTPTNNHLSTSLNTRNQAMVQDGRVDIQTKNAGYGGNANRNSGRQNRNQAFNAGNGNDDNNQIVQRVPRTESTPGKANVQCYNCNEKGHYARDCQKPRIRDAKYFREQMLLAMKNEVGE